MSIRRRRSSSGWRDLWRDKARAAELDGVLFEEPQGALWTREMLEAARAAAGDEAGGVGVVHGFGGGGRVRHRGVRVAGGRGRLCWPIARWRECGPTGGPAGARGGGLGRRPGDRREEPGRRHGRKRARGADAAFGRLVSASRGKVRGPSRSRRGSSGAARLAGRFPELEDELARLTMGGGMRGRGVRGQGRRDVWAMTARPALRTGAGAAALAGRARPRRSRRRARCKGAFRCHAPPPRYSLVREEQVPRQQCESAPATAPYEGRNVSW